VKTALQVARSVLALLLVLTFMLVVGLFWQRLVLWPIALFRRERLRAWTSPYMRVQCRGILGILSAVGGARFERQGSLPTSAGPILILMNHQSLLDICTVVLMARDYVPAFVTRSRYTRGVPVIAMCTRFIDCPSVDPGRDPRGAVTAIERAAPAERHGMLIFAEGHRTLDGQIRPFKTAGAEAVLRTGRWPVYLVVGDGLQSGRRLVDFLANVNRLRGRAEVLGPFEPPADPQLLPAFLSEQRATMVRHLEQMRARPNVR